LLILFDAFVYFAYCLVFNDRTSYYRLNSHQLGHYQVTTLGKLFTPVCLCYQAVYIGTSKSWEVSGQLQTY